ncbi:MAG: DUF3429 family protein [Halorhodospira sp.]
MAEEPTEAKRADGGDSDLEQEIGSATVVIFRSGVTDTRPVLRTLRQHGIEFREVEMPMGSEQMRNRFQRLQQKTGWGSLPQIFVHGAFVGGLDELLQHPILNKGGQQQEAGRKRRERGRLTGWVIGYLGLLPILAGLAAAVLAPQAVHDQAVVGTLIYSAAILSFLGGVHWGTALLREARPRAVMVLSVLPVLVAWLGAWIGVSGAPGGGAIALAAGFAGWFGYEGAADPGTAFPGWYRRMRGQLTAVACLALLLLALFA